MVCVLSVSINAFTNMSKREGLGSCAEESGVTKEAGERCSRVC